MVHCNSNSLQNLRQYLNKKKDNSAQIYNHDCDYNIESGRNNGISMINFVIFLFFVSTSSY